MLVIKTHQARSRLDFTRLPMVLNELVPLFPLSLICFTVTGSQVLAQMSVITRLLVDTLRIDKWLRRQPKTAAPQQSYSVDAFVLIDSDTAWHAAFVCTLPIICRCYVNWVTEYSDQRQDHLHFFSSWHPHLHPNNLVRLFLRASAWH